MTKYFEILKEMPLFHGIIENDIPAMLKCLNAHTTGYAKDDYIKTCGDPANFIGIVLDGEIQILQDDYDGRRTITASFERGAMFAEAFSCAGIPELPVDIMASENSTIMFLNSSRIFRSCGGDCGFHHVLIQNLLQIVARKNMFLNQKLQYMSHKTTKEKVMVYLNDQAKANRSDTFVIPFNRQELADYLGVERSALSVEISKLQKQGYLETNRSYFKLL